jgi:glycine/D-amino acid oxidase-like deaminating enzyme
MKEVSANFELAVVGAGIIGTMVAYLAHRDRPDWNVLLVDRSLVGHGATQYSVGLDLPWGRTALHKRLAIYSAQIFDELKHEIPSLPFFPIPLYGIVRQVTAPDLFNCFTNNSPRIGDSRDESNLRSSFPDLVIRTDQILIAGCNANFGFPGAMTSMIVEQLRESSRMSCWEGVSIENMSRRSIDGFDVCSADGRRFLAKRVVLATGPWLVHSLGKELARESGIRIKKVVAMHIDSPPGPNDPALFFFDDDAFLLPLCQHRRWLYSFTSEEWDCVPEISRLSIGTADRTLALSILGRYCPSFVQCCQGGRVFCDSYGPNRCPVVYSDPSTKDLVVAGAGSGSGFRLAPGIAREALQQLSGLAI